MPDRFAFLRRPASLSARVTGLVGIDTSLANTTILGVEGGYVSNRLHDSQFGDSAKGNGWQLGAYADYDPGAFFLKGVTTYSSFSGDSTRHINFAGLGTGTSFAAGIRTCVAYEPGPPVHATSSPSLTSVTDGPTASTRPTNSCPMTRG